MKLERGSEIGLVNKSIAPFALVVGVPGRQIGWMSEFGEKISLPVYGNGEYICKLVHHQQYPLKARDYYVLTSNGQFEINKIV